MGSPIRMYTEPLSSTLMQSQEYSEGIDFQKYWLVLKRRWLPATGVFGIIVVLAVFNAFQEKPVYQVGGQLLIKQNSSSSLTGLDNKLGHIDPLTLESSPMSTQAEVIRSKPILEKTRDALKLKDKKGKPLDIDLLTQRLYVKPIKGTDVLTIGYEDEDPKLAAAVVNKVLEVYIQNDINNNRAEIVAARKFITEQLPRVEATVSQTEAALRRFKEENGVADLAKEATTEVEAISDLDKKIAEAQAKLADTTARSVSFRDQMDMTAKEALAVSALSESPGVQEALKQLQEVQGKLAVERTRLLDTSPIIESLQTKEAALKALLKERVAQVLGSQETPPVEKSKIGLTNQQLTTAFVQSEADRLGWANQLSALSKTRSAYQQRYQLLPRLQEKQQELERQVKAAQSTYEALLKNLQETQLAENQKIGNAHVISMATVPQKPTASQKKLVIAAGGLVGILLAIATAFLLDLIDKSVKTVKEAKELFGATLLGVIPAYGKPGKTGAVVGEKERSIPKVFARDLPLSPVSEAYQMLQANLRFLSSDKELKAIVVTSSVAKEGKSEVSANLAAAIAQVGRRVLLVDAALRDPSQHHIWNLTNAVGLSNILVGEAEFKIVVQEVMPGLDVLTSGVIPPNPVALLDSKRMASLIETFSKEYDSVIIDAPSLAGVADTPILGKMADGVLLVVRPGVVDSANAKAAKELALRSGQNILGLVANGVIFKNEPDSYFYYTKEDYRLQSPVSKKSPIFGVASNNSRF